MNKLHKMFVLSAIFSMLIAASALAQEGDAPKEAVQESAPAATPVDAAASQPAKDAGTQPKPLNIYGEVQSVNSGAGSMTVQCYDYDTDEEKTIELSVLKDTKIENAPGLSDIKKGDWADITYSVDGAKNTAKSITVEKEEEVPAETMPEGETKE